MNSELIKHMRQLTPTLDKQGKFMFFEVKKSASTSIRRRALAGRSIIYKSQLAKYYPVFDSYSSADLDSMFKFTVVRNPYARVVSAFIYLKKYNRLAKEMDFKNFIKNTLKKKGPDIDPHFHKMSDRAYFEDKMFLDFISRLENIDKDWTFISKNINAPVRLPHANKSKHYDYKKYYDKESIKIVSNIYAEDLDLFGYTF